MPDIDVADKTTLDETKAAVAEAKALLDSIYALVDTEIATLVTNTKANSTASTSGTLSQKLASIINSLANSTYGLNALKTAISNGGGSVIKTIQRGTIEDIAASGSVTLSGFTNLDKMVVLLDGSNRYDSTYGITYYVSGLTLTTLSVACKGVGSKLSNVTISYQVIEYA